MIAARKTRLKQKLNTFVYSNGVVYSKALIIKMFILNDLANVNVEVYETPWFVFKASLYVL